MADDDGEIINEKVRVKIGLGPKKLTMFSDYLSDKWVIRVQCSAWSSTDI